LRKVERLLQTNGFLHHPGVGIYTLDSGLMPNQQLSRTRALVDSLDELGIVVERTISLEYQTGPGTAVPITFTDPGDLVPLAAPTAVLGQPGNEARRDLHAFAEQLATRLPGDWTTEHHRIEQRAQQRDLADDLWISGKLRWATFEVIQQRAVVITGPYGMRLLLVDHPVQPEHFIVGAAAPQGFESDMPSKDEAPAASLSVDSDPGRAARWIVDRILPDYHRAARARVEAAQLSRGITPPPRAHISIDYDAEHAKAIRARVSGQEATLAAMILVANGFRPSAPDQLLLARVDSEEEFYAASAVTALRGEGYAVDAHAELDPEADFDDDWRWGNDVMPWADRSEVREVGAEAQRLYEDIYAGRLIIHAHALDGETPVALGTYTTGGPVLELHGEDHLLQVINEYHDPRQGLDKFTTAYGPGITLGPPQPSGNARWAAAVLARSSLRPRPERPSPPALGAAVEPETARSRGRRP